MTEWVLQFRGILCQLCERQVGVKKNKIWKACRKQVREARQVQQMGHTHGLKIRMTLGSLAWDLIYQNWKYKEWV